MFVNFFFLPKRVITLHYKYVFSNTKNDKNLSSLSFFFKEWKKKETKESFEAWRKNRRARVRVFHSRLRVTSSRGEGEAFKLGPGWTDFLEWLFLSLENTSARKRGSGRGRKTIKIVVNVVAAGVRGGPLGIWILFRSKPFYIRDSLSLLFSNSQFDRGRRKREEKNGKWIDGKDWKKKRSGDKRNILGVYSEEWDSF